MKILRVSTSNGNSTVHFAVVLISISVAFFPHSGFCREIEAQIQVLEDAILDAAQQGDTEAVLEYQTRIERLREEQQENETGRKAAALMKQYRNQLRNAVEAGDKEKVLEISKKIERLKALIPITPSDVSGYWTAESFVSEGKPNPSTLRFIQEGVRFHIRPDFTVVEETMFGDFVLVATGSYEISNRIIEITYLHSIGGSKPTEEIYVVRPDGKLQSANSDGKIDPDNSVIYERIKTPLVFDPNIPRQSALSIYGPPDSLLDDRLTAKYLKGDEHDSSRKTIIYTLQRGAFDEKHEGRFSRLNTVLWIPDLELATALVEAGHDPKYFFRCTNDGCEKASVLTYLVNIHSSWEKRTKWKRYTKEQIYDFAKLLLKKGADPYFAAKSGYESSAVSAAKRNKNADMLRLLEENAEAKH